MAYRPEPAATVRSISFPGREHLERALEEYSLQVKELQRRLSEVRASTPAQHSLASNIQAQSTVFVCPQQCMGHQRTLNKFSTVPRKPLTLYCPGYVAIPINTLFFNVKYIGHWATKG